ncbi:MAG: relaxase/mobilization nuclease domain-containing protein [Gammaproteobacteria bacterium]
MVKVSGGARTLRGVASHLDYIGREGRGDIETDDGQILHEKGIENALLSDWDLDLPAGRGARGRTRKPSKLVHNLVFSMPEGTPPDKLLKAVRTFASNEFGLRHRYAMTLHTDQRHPHVHVVVKAISEDGERLNIRRATLRQWRQDFAQCLRGLGIEANATERAVRGAVTPRKLDGIHRAARRGASTHMQRRAENVAHELAQRDLRVEPGKNTLTRTRDAVLRGWTTLADALDISGRLSEAAAIRKFTARMPAPATEKEWIADRLREARQRTRTAESPELTR